MSCCRWVLADSDGGGASAAGADGAAAIVVPGAAEVPSPPSVYELLPAEDWQLLAMYYRAGADREGGSGGGRKRKQHYGEQLEELLER